LTRAVRLINVDLPGAAGLLEGLLTESTDGSPRATVVLAHPLPTAGGTMHTKVVFHVAQALGRIGCAVLRFNFRGTGRSGGSFDDGKGERDDFRAALSFMSARYPDLTERWAAGMSFGAWVAMTAGATDPLVTALIGVAPPVTRRDFSEVVTAAKPTFLIHGERDELIPLSDVRRFYARLEEPKELVVIDSADHLFDGKASEVGDAIEDLLQDFPPGEPGVSG
jgi:alpha/beta superfamily hydrolase